MKLLNLDTLNKVEKAVTLKGIDYPIVEQTVGQMIIACQLDAKAKSKKQPTLEDQLKDMKKSVMALIPSMEESVVDDLKMPHLTAIIELAVEVVEVETEEGKLKA
jgi:hypothetical protein